MEGGGKVWEGRDTLRDSCTTGECGESSASAHLRVDQSELAEGVSLIAVHSAVVVELHHKQSPVTLPPRHHRARA